jgi:N-methylhydantoinase A/oxoprolinase/acetone carboxylase beta subunit
MPALFSAAGGGSCLTFKNGLFRVGPESAGAHPGPAAYRKGGPLATTDANALLGRLLPDFFPKVPLLSIAPFGRRMKRLLILHLPL